MKIKVKFLFGIMIFVLIIIIFNNSIIYLTHDSKTRISFNLYSSKSIIKLGKVSYLDLKMYLPQNFENFNSSQTISDTSFYIRLSPRKPVKKEIYFDEFGNKIMHVRWERMKAVTVELQFNGLLTSYADFDSFNDSYPLDLSSLSQDTITFLKPTEFTQTDKYEIKYLSRKLSENENLEVKVVYNILNWVKSHIEYNPDHKNYDAFSVLLNREGSREGILNLILALLRSANIPVKASIGYTLPISIRKFKGLSLKFEKGIYNFLEIYFPSKGWLYFDPFKFFASAFVNFIKLGSSLDFINNHYFTFETDAENPQIIDNFEFSPSDESIDYEMESIIENHRKTICFFPEILKQYELKSPNVTDIDEVISYIKYKETEKKDKNVIDYRNKTNYIEIPLVPSRFYQPFNIDKTITIEKIAIPFIKYSGNGKLAIYFYKNNNGKVGKIVGKSYIKTSSSISYGENSFEGLYVYFIFHKLKLTPGKYYFRIVPLSSSLSVSYYAMNYVGGKYISPMIYRYKNLYKRTNFNVIFKLFYE